MAGFQYFVPENVTSAESAKLAKYEIGYAITRGASGRSVISGPGGQAGTVMSQDPSKVKHGYFPDEQVWQPIGETGAFVGWAKDELPRPEELVREQVVSGRSVRLADGNHWLCPIARRPIEVDGKILVDCPLPKRLVFEGGEWFARGVDKRFEGLWLLACRVWDMFEAAATGGEAVTLDVEIEAAVSALAANYRIGPVEASALGLFLSSGDEVGLVLKTLIDLDSWEAIAQKKSQHA